jgi:hypothetical protein
MVNKQNLSKVAENAKEAGNTNKKDIIKTWLAGNHSCTLIIPRSFAHQYGLDEPSHVVVEGTPEGILIRKLEV